MRTLPATGALGFDATGALPQVDIEASGAVTIDFIEISEFGAVFEPTHTFIRTPRIAGIAMSKKGGMTR